MKNLKGLFVFSITNMLERFGFYSMMAILFLSFMDQRGLAPQEAGYYYSIFYIAIYGAMFLMGIVGDFVNRRKVVYSGIIVMAIGYILYHLMSKNNEISLIIPGILVVFGLGAFKTNLQVQVGDLYRNNIKNGAVGYLIFYTLINVGAIFAPFAAVYLRNEYGVNSVFLLSGLVTITAFALYYFVPVSTVTEQNSEDNQKGVGFENNNSTLNTSSVNKRLENTKFGTDKLIGLIFLIIVVPVFWIAFHQNGLVYTFYVRDFIELNGNAPELIQSVNPIAYILLSIIAVPIIFFFVEIKKAQSIFPIIGIGMVIAAIGYFIPAYGLANLTGKLSSNFAIIPMVIITLGELLISPFLILGFYHFSPTQVKGLFMGLFLVITAIGNQLLFTYGIIYDKYGAAHAFMNIVIHILICAAAVFIIWVVVKRLGSIKMNSDVER
ncbi:MAG: MFS transporter [Bacteroidales bacterium]|nr:MFS transporter [Bacteroidales bacterium]